MTAFVKARQLAKPSLAVGISIAAVAFFSMTMVGPVAAGNAAFTTFNAHVDGAPSELCLNSSVNCNVYTAKEYVWLNGGPTANALLLDGHYFFAVLVPGAESNPNDGGAGNLSDDFDCYQNRTFTVTNGEVSDYNRFDCGASYPSQEEHWLDDGKREVAPDSRTAG